MNHIEKLHKWNLNLVLVIGILSLLADVLNGLFFVPDDFTKLYLRTPAGIIRFSFVLMALLRYRVGAVFILIEYFDRLNFYWMNLFTSLEQTTFPAPGPGFGLVSILLDTTRLLVILLSIVSVCLTIYDAFVSLYNKLKS